MHSKPRVEIWKEDKTMKVKSLARNAMAWLLCILLIIGWGGDISVFN